MHLKIPDLINESTHDCFEIVYQTSKKSCDSTIGDICQVKTKKIDEFLKILKEGVSSIL